MLLFLVFSAVAGFSWSDVDGRDNSKPSTIKASDLKRLMKSKGMYDIEVAVNETYVGYKVAHEKNETIGEDLWLSYPRIYGHARDHYYYKANFVYLGRVNDHCDIFYKKATLFKKGREVSRCNDWGDNRFNRFRCRDYPHKWFKVNGRCSCPDGVKCSSSNVIHSIVLVLFVLNFF